MSISVLAHTIGTPTPPAARLVSDPTGSQVAQQTSPASSDANLSGHAGGDASSTPAGNPPIEALGVAGESVTITLSATAQDSIAQQNQALGQLRQVIEQLRNSNHNAASARLKQLLQEFRALQQLGTASARALAALAKQISAAAADLSASGGNAATATTDTSFANETPTKDQTPGDPSNTQADQGSTASAAPPTPVSGSNVPQAAAGTPAAPVGNAGAGTAVSEGQHTPTVGSQTADPRTSATDPSASSANRGVVEASDTQRQALLDHLKEQASQNAAQAQAASADRDLLSQAANAIGAIQRIVKQAAEEEQEKHKGKSSTELDQLAKTVDSSAATVEKAISQLETAPVPAPSSSGAISAVGIDITV